MEKTITIDGKDVRLNNNIGWTMEYRDQFGRDIVPALMPLLGGLISITGGIIEEIGGTGGEVDAATVIQAMSGEKIDDILLQLSQLEITDFINIVWALAKNADGSIQEPRRWVRQFETFPLDEILPVVGEMIIKSVTSSKNWERLQALAEGLKPTKE